MPPSGRQTNIYSLPVELLTYIFVLGSSLDYPYDDSPFLLKPGLGYIPLPSSNFQVVAHVCRHWRQVALRTQALWTILHIRGKEHIPRAVEYLSRCRSPTYLFDILIDTVAVEEHIPDVTLYKDELDTIFEILLPFVDRWRTFHLKVCDNECKSIARRYLTTCGPGPKLETLQLYHFEDFRTTHRLFLATYRPPVTIFDNDLPRLKNVSLIGVNLPWDQSLYLSNLDHLELALHLDNVRAPYRWWDRMLRTSPALKSLSLHYSGPKEATGVPGLAWAAPDDKIQLSQLRELSFTDLDPDYLCNLFERILVPNLKKLTLDLREQDFTPFIQFLTTPHEHPLPAISSSPSTSLLSPRRDIPEHPVQVLGRLQILVIRGLECSIRSWAALLHATHDLRVLEVAFAKTSPRFWRVFTDEGEALTLPAISQGENAINQGVCNLGDWNPALLPRLEAFKLSGVPGADILEALYHRHRSAGRRPPRPSETWTVHWSERRRGKDPDLDLLVDEGYRAHKDGGGAPSVIIKTFDDEEDLGEADDETPSASEDEGEDDKDA